MDTLRTFSGLATGAKGSHGTHQRHGGGRRRSDSLHGGWRRCHTIVAHQDRRLSACANRTPWTYRLSPSKFHSLSDRHSGEMSWLIRPDAQSHSKMLYSGSSDNTARAWVMEFGECTRIYRGHQHTVDCLRYYDRMRELLPCCSKRSAFTKGIW